LPIYGLDEPASERTASDLARLGDAELLNAVVEATARLEQRLARFTTGEGWQEYLQLPADALPPPAADGTVKLGMRSLGRALGRFDSVAGNPTFGKISALPEFGAVRDSLREVVTRFGGGAPPDARREVDREVEELPQIAPTVSGATQPSPERSAEASSQPVRPKSLPSSQSADGEHSILVR
jgi:hypothetical protein